MFDEIIENQRKLSLADKKQQNVEKIILHLEEIFLGNLRIINDNFWKEVNVEYVNIMNLNMYSLRNYLADNYKMDTEEFVEFLKSIEEEIYSSFKKDVIKEKVPDLFNYAVNNFKKDFLYEEAMPRIWNKISESEINALFKSIKEKNYLIFSIFKHFKLIHSPMKCKFFK
jgi:hypothetical protein